MLNTDLHNPSIKEERKMTACQYVSTCRGIDGGRDFPERALRALYASVAADEIRLDATDEGLSDAWMHAHGWLASKRGWLRKRKRVVDVASLIEGKRRVKHSLGGWATRVYAGLFDTFLSQRGENIRTIEQILETNRTTSNKSSRTPSLC